MRWKLREFLKKHDRRVADLIRLTDASPTTVYHLAAGKGEQVKLITLAAVLTGMQRLTGCPVSIADLLEYQPEGDGSSDRIPVYLALAGLLDDSEGPTDVSINHDEYLAQSLEEEHSETVAGER